MYESYYGLTSKPFQLTPDPEFFFHSQHHQRALSYLEYGLSQAEGFIIITGDIGTGKTTIANSLLANIENDIYALQIVTPKLSPDELVKMVASKLMIEVEGKSKSELLEAIEGFLNRLAESGKRALLLVDEAQNLPLETIEELRMLSNYQHQGKPLLQSFLLGQLELQDILRAPNMEQFRQRIVASSHLTPLKQNEMQEYIEHRLAHAGYDGEGLITQEAYDLIYKFTTGVPRKINTLMDRILLYGFLEEIEKIEAEHANVVIDEVSAEMFVPQQMSGEPQSATAHLATDVNQSGDITPPREMMTARGNKIHEASYYKAMLEELVDALDDAMKHKIKLTQYIDKMLKKRYQAYVKMKNEDEKGKEAE